MERDSTATIEDALFGRMGITVDDMLGTVTDIADEAVKQAVERDIPVSESVARLKKLAWRLLEPQSIDAIETLLERLPHMADLAKQIDQVPGLVGAVVDIADERQRRLAESGIDLREQMASLAHLVAALSTLVSGEPARRLTRLLNDRETAERVADTVVRGAEAVAEATADRPARPSAISDQPGLFGLLRALRNPDVRRTVGLAMKVGESMGRSAGPSQD